MADLTEEQEAILQKFSDIMKNQTDMPADIQKVIDDNFFELLATDDTKKQEKNLEDFRKTID